MSQHDFHVGFNGDTNQTQTGLIHMLNMGLRNGLFITNIPSTFATPEMTLDEEMTSVYLENYDWGESIVDDSEK